MNELKKLKPKNGTKRGDGIAARVKRCKAVTKATGNPRAGIRAYCRGNRWLTENAKAVGNW